MFDKDFGIYGKHANYLKDLCELRGNVPDKAQHANFKIFTSYVDAYILCPLLGYQYGRKGVPDNSVQGDAGILTDALMKRRNELKYVYQVLMLVDEDSEKDEEKRINRAFNFAENNDDEKLLIEKNMKIYNSYFLGGIEVLHEIFVDKCIDADSYLNSMYEFVKKFEEEQDDEKMEKRVDAILK